ASTERACGPTATTRDQASRRAPIAAVAGITMPPDDRRSPASVSASHRIRSWSILIGALSADPDEPVAPADATDALLIGPSSGDLAEHDHQRDHADDRAGRLQDVVRARLARLRVDVVRLDL